MNYDKEIYIIIFQGGDRTKINVVRTNESFLKLYSRASKYIYDNEEEATDTAIKLAKENYLSYIGNGDISEYSKPNKQYLD